MKYGIEFNGKHTFKDYGITIAEKDVGYPDKEKIKVKVPFSNVEYDFSELYGGQTYTERPLNFTLNVLDKHRNISMQEVNTIETNLSNWLMNSSGKQRLYDDAMPGYYYLAEVEKGLDFEELRNYGTLSVEFTAYPFMISNQSEGNDLWDPFNFELDVFQDVEFNINGKLEVVLYNVGTPNLSPGIQASSEMTIKKGGTTYQVPKGENESLDFVLTSGENNLTIEGNGTIKFLFYKELI